ncbi:hypothetical protein NHX12_026138 [Muraenolepis orangiensis]|uniref:BAH domain-containing protein n=1 Tax=Muraenolepis orangiensis TaxID=630683 RepID=A0A9Q0ELM0_9TELE|nr:hypothetical protein NHX12_026138 [Muraenolepis orangiensis]
MTHSRRKASLRKSHSPEGRDNSSHWPNGDNMDVAPPQRLLRFGRTKKIDQIIPQGKDEAKRGTDRKRHRKSAAVLRTRRKLEEKRTRKSYPLRGRTAGEEDEEDLNCRVLLTRLEEGQQRTQRRRKMAKGDGRQKLSHKSKSRKDKRGGRPKETVISETKVKSNIPRDVTLNVPDPRKRRLASLNAEAVNSLLLERGSDQNPSAKQAKRRSEEPTREAGPPGGDSARSRAAAGCHKTSQSGTTQAASPLRPQPAPGSEPVKRKARRGDLGAFVSQVNLDTPAPRRLAGLTAATLLKLTSTSATGKQRAKTAPTATITTATTNTITPATITADSDASGRAASTISPTRVKPGAKRSSQRGKKAAVEEEDDTACKDKADFEPKVEWESGGRDHKLADEDYRPRSMPAFPLKSVKEEQVETGLRPYYCCPPEGAVEYCHPLAFFLGQRAYGDPDDRPLDPSLAPLKRECPAARPHPHPALTLSPHPCLCTAERCFSGYYVHIAHPPHAGPPAARLASRALGFGPSSLRPDRVSGSEPPDPRSPHNPGPARPTCCGSVGSPCYGEACRIGGYAYRAVPPVASRGCSFSAGCTGCTHSIKTEGYSSPQGIAPSLPPPSCPPPATPSSTRTEPHPPTPSSTRAEPRPPPPSSGPPARLRLAHVPPVSTGRPHMAQKRVASPAPSLEATPPAPSLEATPPAPSLEATPPAPSLEATPPAPSPGGARQKRVSRCRTTNGWRPVGVAVEREVFIAGEEESSRRRCYEGVQRDGEVIHVRDTVLLRAGPRRKTLPYVAKISALWEDPKTGELMMSLFWYYRPEHTQGGRDPGFHCENEIFASRHQDENSVACIEDRCYLVYLCRHVYDFRSGRILKNLQ